MSNQLDNSPIPPAGAQGTGMVWDLPTRLCHWLIALCFAGSWITAEAGFDWTEVHFYLGYTTLGLVLFRLIWGFVGPRYARFTNFVRGPGTVWRYLRGQSTPVAGHNPLGALAILAMLFLLGLQASVGLFISDDIFYAGPYNAMVAESTAGQLAYVHHLNFRFLQALVAMHLLAIAWHSWYRRHGLVAPMIHGRKAMASGESIQSSRLGRAVLVAAVVGGLIYLLLEFAPPPRPIDFY